MYQDADHCFVRTIYSVKLQAIHRFTSTATAVEDMTAIGEGKVSKSLKKFLTEEVTGNKKFKNEKLAVSEPKLGMSFLRNIRSSDQMLREVRSYSWCDSKEARGNLCRFRFDHSRPLPRNPTTTLCPSRRYRPS